MSAAWIQQSDCWAALIYSLSDSCWPNRVDYFVNLAHLRQGPHWFRPLLETRVCVWEVCVNLFTSAADDMPHLAPVVWWRNKYRQPPLVWDFWWSISQQLLFLWSWQCCKVGRKVHDSQHFLCMNPSLQRCRGWCVASAASPWSEQTLWKWFTGASVDALWVASIYKKDFPVHCCSSMTILVPFISIWNLKGLIVSSIKPPAILVCAL